MKFCVNCNNCLMTADNKNNPTYWKCYACPKDTNLVSGKIRYQYCEWAREKGNLCDTEGKLFQPKKGD